MRDILAPPKYVMSVFSHRNELGKYKRRINMSNNKILRDTALMYLEKLRHALEKADGLDEIFFKHMENKTGKYILFCLNIDAMRECIGMAS